MYNIEGNMFKAMNGVSISLYHISKSITCIHCDVKVGIDEISIILCADDIMLLSDSMENVWIVYMCRLVKYITK